MKRFIALLLALLMLAATGAFAEAPSENTEEKNVAGPWYGNLNGLPFTLDLREDGTYTFHVMCLPDADSEGSWTHADGVILLDGDADLPLTVFDNSLYFNALDLFLTREEEKSYVPEEILGNEESDQTLFQGAWSSRYVLLDGAVLPTRALQDDTILYVEGSKAALTGDLFGEIVADFAYDNGAMVMSTRAMTVKLEMQKDFMMRMTVSSEGDDLTVILAPYMTELLTSSVEGADAEREDPDT